ncbi:MAG: hypothetical protein FJ146_10470 [Deltaproteobacteria bacterium]|nr:hypothetical protein [Deltaproteobacteria bacterium]
MTQCRMFSTLKISGLSLMATLALTSASHAKSLPELNVTSQPMRLFLGRVINFEPSEIAPAGGPVKITYAKQCTEYFENLVFKYLPRIDPEAPAPVAVGAIMSGTRCDQCNCPEEAKELSLNVEPDTVTRPLVAIAPTKSDAAELYPARILGIQQEPVSEDEVEVTVTYLETCDTTLVNVIPVEVSPIGGYNKQVGVLALAQHNATPCPYPSHPMSQKFRYPSNKGGYRFLPVEAE